jgi:hypothetical protein
MINFVSLLTTSKACLIFLRQIGRNQNQTIKTNFNEVKPVQILDTQWLTIIFSKLNWFFFRPKKTTTCLPSTRVVRDDDPCLDSLATESILPLIPERMVNPSGMATTTNGQGTSTNSKGSQGTQVSLFEISSIRLVGLGLITYPI